MEIHRLTARLRALRRFGLDLCLGRMVRAANPEPAYVGRLGLTDSEGRRLLLDWRSPAAGPLIWEELLTILMDSRDGDVPEHLLRKSLLQNTGSNAAAAVLRVARLRRS